MAFWLLNYVPGAAAPAVVFDRVKELLDAGMCQVGDDEPHRDSLAIGDLVLIYLGAPERVFVGRAEVASPVQRWLPGDLPSPGPGRSGIRVTRVVRWDPPVAMSAVLARIDPANHAKADFDRGVVGITRDEFEATVDAAAASGP